MILRLRVRNPVDFEAVTSQSASHRLDPRTLDGRNLLERWQRWLLRLDSNQQPSG